MGPDDSARAEAGTPPSAPSPVEGAPPPARRSLVPLALAFYSAAVAIAIAVAAWRGALGTLLGERVPDALGIAYGLGFAAVVIALSRAADATIPAVRRAGEAMTDALGPMNGREMTVLAIASGVAEELLFRGALQPWLGLVVTSLLFGAVHVVPRRALALYPLFAAVMGAALGWLRIETGSVVPPAIAHAVVNGVNLGWLESRVRGREPPA